MLNLPTNIISVLSIFYPLFSRSVFFNLVKLLTGHLLCKGTRTITNCLRQIGLSNEARYSKYHDVFRISKWSSSKASKILLHAIDKQWIGGKCIQIVIDTTLERRRGPHLYGLGMHRDAVRSSKSKKAFSCGHNWLVACVIIQFPASDVKWALPFLSILLHNQKSISSSKNDGSNMKRYKKMTRYTEQIVIQLRRWLGKGREIELIADSAFCCRSICRVCIKHKVTFFTPLRLNAALHDFPPEYSGRGRPRIVGKRMPNLEEVASNPSTSWKTVIVRWYGGEEKKLEICSEVTLWYHNSTGKPVPIRWVITRDPNDFNDIYGILCTDMNCNPVTIIEKAIDRWCIETTFQEVRSELGYETLRTWSKKGIERVSPSVMASYSLVCLIAAETAERNKETVQPLSCAWYQKKHVTFSDALVYVKLLIMNEQILTHTGRNGYLRKNKIREILLRAVAI